jgi:hypothetical protein
MKIIFYSEFDGILNLQVGDLLEIKILKILDGDCFAETVRQMSVNELPALGVNVNDSVFVKGDLNGT